MYNRLLSVDKDASFFLFGPRGTGKSTLLKNLFPKESCLFFDLLKPELEDEFSRAPERLRARVLAAPKTIKRVVLDEVQKAPRLLDVVHALIEETGLRFALSGSSARKLRRGGADLLAGRAQVLELHPFSAFELGDGFDLDAALAFGTLPLSIAATSDRARRRFLTSYAHSYLKEEVQAEQFVRRLEPFRRFLDVAAQMSGKIVNHASIARDVGADDKTVASYYQILEDTLLGRPLEPFDTSLRRRVAKKPKFYLFDNGVRRALARELTIPLVEGTSAYGEYFESFFINECFRLNHYLERDFAFSYLMTKDGVEIDLVAERPGRSLVLLEVKSAKRVDDRMLSSLKILGSEFEGAERICAARVEEPELHDGIRVLPWRKALESLFEMGA